MRYSLYRNSIPWEVTGLYRDFGMTLAAKRKERHLNQLQLADLLNKKGLEVKSGSISKWEKNVNSPNVIQFFALCEILGIDNINDTFGIAIEENLFAQLASTSCRLSIFYHLLPFFECSKTLTLIKTA